MASDDIKPCLTGQEDEHPAARRMREDFEKKYGQHHPIALALRHYYNTRKEYDDAWNRDREKPVTLEDVECVEREVFAAADRAVPAPAQRLMSDVEDWLNDLLDANFDGYVPQNAFSEARDLVERFEALRQPSAGAPAAESATDVVYRWRALDYSGFCYGSNPPDLPQSASLTAFYRQPDTFHAALHEISATGNLTATPAQFGRHLQKIARDALSGAGAIEGTGEVATLRSALGAMLTQFGMDEDEFSKPTFDQARRALAAASPAQDDHDAFEAAMVEAGYQHPPRGAINAAQQYLYMRDQDRYVGWQLARPAAEFRHCALSAQSNVCGFRPCPPRRTSRPACRDFEDCAMSSDAQTPEGRFMAAFDAYLDEAGVADALSAATTIFVSLVVSYTKARGHDTSQPIIINGSENRDITIHAPKEQSHAGITQ